MKGADATLKPRTIFSFNTPDDIKTFATGCDADIGGLSTTNFDLDTRPEINKPLGKESTGRFHGRMSLGVKPGMEGKIRAGYAGFRNKVRTPLSTELGWLPAIPEAQECEKVTIWYIHRDGQRRLATY